MSQSKLTVGQYSLLLLDLKTTHTDFIGKTISVVDMALNIWVYFVMPMI